MLKLISILVQLKVLKTCKALKTVLTKTENMMKYEVKQTKPITMKTILFTLISGSL